MSDNNDSDTQQEQQEQNITRQRSARVKTIEIECILAPEEIFVGRKPNGWLRRTYERQRDDDIRRRTDKYWYSPICGHKFRSLTQVKIFFDILDSTNLADGDEDLAYELFKERGHRA